MEKFTIVVTGDYNDWDYVHSFHKVETTLEIAKKLKAIIEKLGTHFWDIDWYNSSIVASRLTIEEIGFVDKHLVKWTDDELFDDFEELNEMLDFLPQWDNCSYIHSIKDVKIFKEII